MVSESAVYKLTMRSDLPTARPFQDRPLRTALIDGSPWFVAADVARALGTYQGGQGVRMRFLRDDEHRVVRKRDTQTLGLAELFPRKTPALAMISESGLYKLIMRSDQATARPFQEWVTREVLPSTRKASREVGGRPNLGFPCRSSGLAGHRGEPA